MSSEKKGMSWKSPEVLVPFVGLIYAAAYLAYVFIPYVVSGSIPDFAIILIPFSLVFLGAAIGVWMHYRLGFVVSIVMSALFVASEVGFVGDSLGNPSDLNAFFPVVTIFPALVATLLYSILGLRLAWKKGAPRPLSRSIPLSSFAAILVVGFIVGALVVGVFAGATQSRLLGNLGTQADIVIVKGAGTQGNSAGYFSPANFTAKVGDTVVWSNGDAGTHTITAVASGSFDSGAVVSGSTFSHTFAEAGTYQYYCVIHPWMKGTIVVTSN